MKEKSKIIIILGQTATGKSSLAVHLAKKFGGEVISADSRQIYRGLNIGTEKITKREMRGIPHHLIDIASPKQAFTAAHFKREAEKTLRYIERKGDVPIIAGGTGFYIQTIVDGIVLPEVKPNAELRKELEKKTPEQLLVILKKIDPERAKTVEQKNKRRLIRSIEVAKALGRVPRAKNESRYNVLQIGIKVDNKTLRKRIDERLIKTVRKGLVAETKRLRKQLSWRRINELGLEYRIAGEYLRGEIDKQTMIENMQREVWKYAKRQMTWFKRDKHIKWFNPNEKRKIEQEVRAFLA